MPAERARALPTCRCRAAARCACSVASPLLCLLFCERASRTRKCLPARRRGPTNAAVCARLPRRSSGVSAVVGVLLVDWSARPAPQSSDVVVRRHFAAAFAALRCSYTSTPCRHIPTSSVIGVLRGPAGRQRASWNVASRAVPPRRLHECLGFSTLQHCGDSSTRRRATCDVRRCF